MQKIQREYFISIVGFFGNTAVVDKKLKQKIAKLSVSDLLEQGFYKEAVSTGFYNNDEKEQEIIMAFFQKKQYVENFDSIVREFGIQKEIFDKIQQIKKI